MKENKNHPRDLEQRTFIFAVNIINLLKKITSNKINDVVTYQLAKAATSVGANYEEAQGACSKDDFIYKIGICFREAKESNYWLRIIEETNMSKSDSLNKLIKESEELKKIFGSMLKKMKL